MIDSEVYSVTRQPRFFWQKRQQVWLIVAYYDEDTEKWKAKAEASRRARRFSDYKDAPPIETRIYKRQKWDETE